MPPGELLQYKKVVTHLVTNLLELVNLVELRPDFVVVETKDGFSLR